MSPEDILARWTWRLAKATRKIQDRRASAEFPEAKRLLGTLANSRRHRHEENAGRLVNVALEQPIRVAAALLASAEGYTPTAQQLIERARERIGTISEVANALAENLPQPKSNSGKRRRRKKRKKDKGGAKPAAPNGGGQNGAVEAKAGSDGAVDQQGQQGPARKPGSRRQRSRRRRGKQSATADQNGAPADAGEAAAQVAAAVDSAPPQGDTETPGPGTSPARPGSARRRAGLAGVGRLGARKRRDARRGARPPWWSPKAPG